jgi:hypothetical protein
MSFAVSGASTVPASDDRALVVAGNDLVRASATSLVTGLTAGSNTFTAQYRVNQGIGTFQVRDIIVIPLD